MDKEPDRFQEYPYSFYGGEKIKFASEKQRYTVRCASKRYAICTKAFNARKTVLYTIIDQWQKLRSPEDLVFGMDAAKQMTEAPISELDETEKWEWYGYVRALRDIANFARMPATETIQKLLEKRLKALQKEVR